MKSINWDVSTEDARLIARIATRAQKINPEYDGVTVAMDLTACHANGCALDLAAMHKADKAALMHDVIGINSHLNHDTGKLSGHFEPRFTLREAVA